MTIVCQQTILMKYQALFVIFEKAAKFEIVVCCNYRWHLKSYLVAASFGGFYLKTFWHFLYFGRFFILKKTQPFLTEPSV